jgi:hypothetical protein
MHPVSLAAGEAAYLFLLILPGEIKTRHIRAGIHFLPAKPHGIGSA